MIDKILIWLSQSLRWAHVIAGMMIAFMVGIVLLVTLDNKLSIPSISLLMATLAGFGKELYDKEIKHEKPDIDDIFATVFGGIFISFGFFILVLCEF